MVSSFLAHSAFSFFIFIFFVICVLYDYSFLVTCCHAHKQTQKSLTCNRLSFQLIHNFFHFTSLVKNPLEIFQQTYYLVNWIAQMRNFNLNLRLFKGKWNTNDLQ
jgi:hypothetical protein